VRTARVRVRVRVRVVCAAGVRRSVRERVRAGSARALLARPRSALNEGTTHAKQQQHPQQPHPPAARTLWAVRTALLASDSRGDMGSGACLRMFLNMA
jgi:hypothetical protein